MPVEMIGWVTPQIDSELIAATGPVFNHDAIERAARIHEEADFDRALFGYFSDAPDGFLVAAHAATVTKRLKFLMAHRPGFIAPTLAARKFATLDQLTHGRASIHLIAGGRDAEQARDGDFALHDERYTRMGEYVDLLKKVWTETEPFDYDGDFYKVVQAHSQVRCEQQPRLPIFGGGGSAPAIETLAPRVDVFMLWGESLAATQVFMDRVRGAAGPANRDNLTFSVSTRPILGRTDTEAWERAHAILDSIESRHSAAPAHEAESVGSQRLLRAAAEHNVFDTCLWMKIAEATGAFGNTTALVGSPETVANALLSYYKLGARCLLIRGFDPLNDAEDYGRELIPRLRELVADYDCQ